MIASALVLSGLLTACGGDAAEPSSQNAGTEASGEILESSVSDEMIPLQELESQAPSAATDDDESDDDEADEN